MMGWEVNVINDPKPDLGNASVGWHIYEYMRFLRSLDYLPKNFFYTRRKHGKN